MPSTLLNNVIRLPRSEYEETRQEYPTSLRAILVRNPNPSAQFQYNYQSYGVSESSPLCEVAEAKPMPTKEEAMKLRFKEVEAESKFANWLDTLSKKGNK